MAEKVEIRECSAFDELMGCVRLQREVFALPEVEISPVRHLIVTINAGGFVLGAFLGGGLVGFTLSVPAFLRGESAFYSHMTAISPTVQSLGLGASLKWEQRRRSLSSGVRFIKWTFEPVKARNAYFNIEKLGATVREFMPDFYGTNYGLAEGVTASVDMPSDRVFAEWHLDDPKVEALAEGKSYVDWRTPRTEIVVANDWASMAITDPVRARDEQTRVREEFVAAFHDGLISRSFIRDNARPRYVLFED